MREIAYLILFLIALVVVKKYWQNYNFDLSNIQTVKHASWIWGHEKAAFEDERAVQWRSWFRENGKVIKIKGTFAHPDILAVADPGALSYILTKNPYNFWRVPSLRAFFERIAGQGLVWIEGYNAHRRMRSAVSPAFSDMNVAKMTEDIFYVANRLQSKITQQIVLSGKKTTQIDISRYMSSMSIDILGRTSLGHDFDALGDNKEVTHMLDLWDLQNSQAMNTPAFVAMMILRHFPWAASLPLPGLKDQVAVSTYIRERAKDMVASWKGVVDKGNKDLMSLMILSNEGALPSKKLSMSDIYENVVTFILAGHETTATVLTFGIHMLSQNQEIQSMLRKEILEFEGEPTYQQLRGSDQLPLLDAVCKENIRLYPIMPRFEKVVQRDDVIPLRDPIRGVDGKWLHSFPVKKGQLIYLPIMAVNRDNDMWGDADVFRPTRWLVGHPEGSKYCKSGEVGVKTSKELTGGWEGMLSFSEGPRACIGMRLALFEYKIIMFTLIKNFVFTDAGHDIMERCGATIGPRIRGKEFEGIQLPVIVSAVA